MPATVTMKKYQIIIWLVALVVGVGIGLLRIEAIDSVMNFIATVFTRLFRLLAVPTIILAVINTLASLGVGKEMSRMFRTALTYTLLTTTAASVIGLGLYLLVSPGNLPAEAIDAEVATGIATGETAEFSYADHLLTVIPDNIIKPLLDGNVLALLLICFAVALPCPRCPTPPRAIP